MKAEGTRRRRRKRSIVEDGEQRTEEASRFRWTERQSESNRKQNTKHRLVCGNAAQTQMSHLPCALHSALQTGGGSESLSEVDRETLAHRLCPGSKQRLRVGQAVGIAR